MDLSKLYQPLYKIWSKGSGPYILLVLLFLAIFVIPTLENAEHTSGIIAEICFLLILIAGVFVVECKSNLRLIVFLFAALAFAGKVFRITEPNEFSQTVDDLLSIITLSFFTFLIVEKFFNGAVDIKNRIASAIAVYLLLGVVWGKLYGIIFILDPTAFIFSNPHDRYSLLYFSFVTLLTIGYGDIVPASLVARNLTIVEGVVGQLYLVLLISSLASKFFSNTLSSSKSDQK